MLIILTGPPGAGKSTVADRLAYKFPRSVNFSIDDIRAFVKAGNVPPWEDTDEEGQHVLATEIAIDMIKRYEIRNFVVILDDVFDDNGVRKYKEHFADIHAFLLLPSLEVLKKRDAGRVSDKQMGERAELLYNELADREYELLKIIDSTEQTPDETAEEIYNQVAGIRPSNTF